MKDKVKALLQDWSSRKQADSSHLDELTARITESVKEQAMEESIGKSSLFPSHQPHIPKLLFSAAALLLLVFGFSNWFQTTEPVSSPLAKSKPPVPLISAKNKFLILYTRPDNQTLLARDCDSFEVAEYQVGDRIGPYLIQSVENGFISFQDGQDVKNRLSIQEINTASTRKLQEEVQGLSLKLNGGHFTEGDLARLGSIARFGEETAMKLMEAIATSAGPWREQASQVFGEGEEVNYIGALIQRSLNAGTPYREERIRALATLDNVLAYVTLKKIAMDPKESEPIRLLALRSLRRREDIDAVKEILEFSRKQDASSARILQEINNMEIRD